MIRTPPRPFAPAVAPATPGWLYVVGIFLALLVGSTAAVPKLLLTTIVVSFVGALLVTGARKPWFALALCVCLYPIMSVARPIHNILGLPIYNSGVRCFPELIQVMILMYVMVRYIKDRNQTTRLQFTWDDSPVIVYLLVALYSVVIGCLNAHPLAPLNGWFVSITPAVFYLMVRWLKPTGQQKDTLIRTVLCVYVTVALLSMLDYFCRTDFGVALANSERPYFVPEGVPPSLYWRIYPRMQSILWEENYFAELSNIVILFSVSHLLYQRARKPHYFTLVVSLVSLLLTISRGGYMSLVVGLCVLLLQRSPNRRIVLIAIGVLVVGAATVLSTTSGAPILIRLSDRLETLTVQNAESGDLVSDRADHWKIALNSFQLYPSGTGLGTAGIAAAYSKVAVHSIGEGIFFRVLAEQGAIGLFGFVYMLGGTAWVLWRYLPVCDPVDRPLGAAMLAFHTGFVVHSAVASTFDYYFVVPVYWLLIGLFVSRTHQYLQKQATATSPRYVPLLPAKN